MAVVVETRKRKRRRRRREEEKEEGEEGDGKGDGMSVFVPRRGFACWDLKKEKEKYREKNVWSCFFFVAVDEEEGQKKNRVKSRGKSYAGKARSD